MKMNDHCLPCLINQTVKVAHMTKTGNKEELYQKFFNISVHWISRLQIQKSLAMCFRF